MKPNTDQLIYVSSSVNHLTNPARYGDAVPPKVVAPNVAVAYAPDVPRIIDTSLQINRQTTIGRP